MRRMVTAIMAVVFAALLLVGCRPEKEGQKSESGAKQAKLTFEVPLNYKGNTVEQQNIIDRLRITTNPTKVLWIHLIALDGGIIKRMPVRCKVTSSGKRLYPTEAVDADDYRSPPIYRVGEEAYYTPELLQPDGTYGRSDNYIYWLDPLGRYHQWGTAGGLGYLVTDYPIDLKNPFNEITGLYNMHEAARKWQLEQEAELLREESEGREREAAASVGDTVREESK